MIVATGGTAQSPELDAGEELITSSWDLLAGGVKPEGSVLLFDDDGGHPGMSAAKVIADAGAELELVSQSPAATCMRPFTKRCDTARCCKKQNGGVWGAAVCCLFRLTGQT